MIEITMKGLTCSNPQSSDIHTKNVSRGDNSLSKLIELKAFPYAPRFKIIYSFSAGDWTEDRPGLFRAFILKKDRYHDHIHPSD